VSALASLADVKRILRIPSTSTNEERDARLQAALDAIESWASQSLWKISAEGPNVEVFFDVRDDSTLHLPASDLTVTKVKIIPAYGVDDFYWLYFNESSTGAGFDLDDQGRLMLRPAHFYAPFEGARAERLPRYYARVEVHYIGSGVVPRAVTEGIAFLAAGYYTHAPTALNAIKSEKIGDYSYTLGSEGGDGANALPYIEQAFFFLRDFMRRQKVAVC
jgi:hypothetical protein